MTEIHLFSPKHKWTVALSVLLFSYWLTSPCYATALDAQPTSLNSADSKNGRSEPSYARDNMMPPGVNDEGRDYRYPVPTDFDFAYIDKTGKIAISGPFGCARNFSHKRAAVYVSELQLLDGKWKPKYENTNFPRWAIIDTQGYLLSPPSFEHLDSFAGALTHATINGPDRSTPFVEVFVDPNGNIQSEPTLFKDAKYKPFSEGLAAVVDMPKDFATVQARVAKYGNQELAGYVDENMKIKIPLQFAEAEQFSEGLAVVVPSGIKESPVVQQSSSIKEVLSSDKTARLKQLAQQANARYEKLIEQIKAPTNKAYIDKTGKIVIPGLFQVAKKFHDGFAAVEKDGRWGFIDRTGAIAVPFTYDYADDFGDGLGLVEKDKKVGFIDSKNNTVIPFKFADAQPFTEGVAAATLDGIHWGYVDKTGEFVLPPTFKRAYPFHDGLALVFANPLAEWGTRKSEAPYFYYAARRARTDLDLTAAQKACEIAIRLDPESVWSEKCKSFQKFVLPAREIPDSVLKEFGAARALRLANDSQAEVKLKDCIKKCPDFEWPYGELAVLLIDEDRYDEAQSCLDEILKISPNYVRGYVWKSRVKLHQGDLKGARELVAKARALDPDDELIAQLEPIPASP